MTEDDLSARLFVRLYTSLLDDEDMVELSYAAIGVYAVVLLVSKHTASDGRVPLKLLRRDAALRPGTPLDDALDELVDAGLVTVDDGLISVRSWAKYNALVAEILDRRAARKAAARRAAHERWHDGPFETCPKCYQRVSPGQCGSHAPPNGPHANAMPKSHSHSHSKSHSDSDPSASDSASPPDGCDPGDVDVADSLIEILGYFGEPSTSGERRYVARARQRGWTTEQLVDVAHLAAAKTDVDDVRQYLGGCLAKRANNDPPPELRAADPNDFDLDFADLTGLPADPDAEIATRYGTKP